MHVNVKIRRHQHTHIYIYVAQTQTGPRRHARAPACCRHHNPTACPQTGVPHDSNVL